MTVVDNKPETQVDMYGTARVSSNSQPADLPMTPYESLLWNVWLPKVRSCINNDWSPSDPKPAVLLFEAWSDIIPPFIRDNILDQLILPKVFSAVASWNSKKDAVSLQAIVFPWLPFVGLRMEEFMDEARRKMKSLLRAWMTRDGVPKDLLRWKEVYNATEWEAMMLKYIVPKLGATLRDDFRIYPPKQDWEPMQQVLQWSEILRPSIFGQLLETELFPKWLDVLHFWLIQPTANFDEVVEWYKKWRDTFPKEIQDLPAIKNGLTSGLQMMNHAADLGPDAPKKLPKPDHKRRLETQRTSSGLPGTKKEAPQRALPSRMQEITFRSIAEEYAASHNLLFMPAGKVHEKSRLPLFRVAKTVDGKGGLLVYLLDDAVWASDGDEYRAITLEDMVLRAARG